MNFIKHSLLGLLQGITEAFPISSSGHLVLFKELFPFFYTNNLNLEIILNFGGLVAIILIYKNEILKIIQDFFLYIKTKQKKYETNFKYGLYIILGTIPAAIIGLLLKKNIERIFSLKMLGIGFLMTAAFLFISRNKNGKRGDKDITLKDSIIIGLYQAVALLPGVSRSGVTISSALNRDINRESSLKFSFMLYIPISLASFILGIKDIASTPNINTLWLSYLVATIISGIGTYFMFKVFRKLLVNKKINLVYFSIYTLLLGLYILLI